tara:strand:+ start:695 stop:1312 length:618 start_codon:yes stop_codon:yes gene_type:complete
MAKSKVSNKIKKHTPAAYRNTDEFKKLKIAMSSKKISRGNVSNLSATPNRYRINRAGEVLAQQGMKQADPYKATTEKKAHDLLYACGFSVQVSQQDYNLVDSVVEAQEIENPLTNNVYINHALNHNIEMVENFPNPNDPIYEPDNTQPHQFQVANTYMSIEVAQNLDLVATGNVISGMGLSNTPATQTSRYFNNFQVAKALKDTK